MPDDIVRESNGHFSKGNPGGPGRPRKPIVQSAITLDEKGSEVGERVFQMLVDKALAGDLKAADMLMQRIWPTRRGRPVELEVTPVRETNDLVQASADITNAVMTGELTPREGREFCGMLEAHCEVIQTLEYERQIDELMERAKQEDSARGTFAPFSTDRATVFDGFAGGSKEKKP